MKLKNNNNLIIKSNFITNFKPNILSEFNELKNFKNKQIYCRNFLLYVIFLKYLNNGNESINLKTKLFFKKKVNKLYTILKSPYRHKLARHQISFNRFYIYSILTLNLKNLYLKKFTEIINILNVFKNFNKIFETNIIYTNNMEVSFKLFFNKNFYINSYVKKNIKKVTKQI